MYYICVCCTLLGEDPILRESGAKWMITGPYVYIPPIEVTVVDKRCVSVLLITCHCYSSTFIIHCFVHDNSSKPMTFPCNKQLDIIYIGHVQNKPRLSHLITDHLI